MNEQLSLWEVEQEQDIAQPVKKLTDREYLFNWGMQHSFPEFDFPIGNGVLGDFRAGTILSGESNWNVLIDWPGDIDKLWMHKAIAYTKELDARQARPESEHRV